MMMHFHCEECGKHVENPLNLGVLTISVRIPVFNGNINIGYKRKTYESGNICEDCYKKINKSSDKIIQEIIKLKSTKEIKYEQ